MNILRDIYEYFSVTNELACMRLLKKTAGSEILHEFQKPLSILKVHTSSICNITTDGASRRIGKNLDLLEFVIKTIIKTSSVNLDE